MGKTSPRELAKRARYCAKNPERVRESKNRSRLKYEYQLSPEQVIELIDAQQGLCANPTCRCDLRTRTARGVHIDHCHATGVVRGVLCNGCNVAFGTLGDTAAQLRLALSYLDSFEQTLASCTHDASSAPGRRCSICFSKGAQ